MTKKRKQILGILVLVFLLSAGMVLRNQMQYAQIAAGSSEAAQTAGLLKSNRPEWTPVPPSPEEPEAPEPLPEEAAALADIDLAALQAINADVFGWIEIPGTELSYPLVQGSDNQYYLTHNWKKEDSAGGAVFLESTNDKSLSGFHSIAYAHRMRNGSMFGLLRDYNKQDFWQEHPSVYVMTDGGVSRYDIFSAREISVKGIVYRLDLEQSHLEDDFVQNCVGHSVLETGLVPESSGRFLTLSTCTGNGHATRWVVHCVLAQTYPL